MSKIPENERGLMGLAVLAREKWGLVTTFKPTIRMSAWAKAFFAALPWLFGTFWGHAALVVVMAWSARWLYLKATYLTPPLTPPFRPYLGQSA